MTKRPFLVLLAFAAAGCAGGPGSGSPRTLVVTLAQDPAQVDRDRQTIRRIFGSDALSNGELLREVAIDELRARGYEASKGTTGPDVEAELASVRGAGGAEGLLVIRVGEWKLDSAASSGQATVEYELVLLRVGDGSEIWADRVPRRTITLQAGEPRDLEALVRRLVLQSLRSYP